MAMQIHGNYDHSGTDYTERLKEKQAAERAEKAKEAEKVEKAAEEKNAGKMSEPRDEYISSEKSGQKPTGLYRVGQDENGNRKLFFDDPKAGHANGRGDRSEESENGKAPKAGGDSQGKPAEKCVTNTDKVDREIKKLKEKKQELEQQIQSASGDEKKIRELEKKLAQVENELSQKDNDTYRRQNASVSE
ncbi:MAG: hypothetical protein HFG25_04380 [Lachnospiraceae bacterium]|nr:hypothetical protein [Lachnospiraceae bacterium]